MRLQKYKTNNFAKDFKFALVQRRRLQFKQKFLYIFCMFNQCMNTSEYNY